MENSQQTQPIVKGSTATQISQHITSSPMAHENHIFSYTDQIPVPVNGIPIVPVNGIPVVRKRELAYGGSINDDLITIDGEGGLTNGSSINIDNLAIDEAIAHEREFAYGDSVNDDLITINGEGGLTNGSSINIAIDDDMDNGDHVVIDGDQFINDVNVEENYILGITEKEYFASLPSGFRFEPQDHELITDYLKKKIENQKLPHNLIKLVNLYQYSPYDITAFYPEMGERKWYFFTPRDRKYQNGSRPNRAAGSGYWKATGKDKSIKKNGHDGPVIGFRKALVFYDGRPRNGNKTNWIMHEYRVNEPSRRVRTSETDMRLDDYVLCKIVKKAEKIQRNRGDDESSNNSASSSIKKENQLSEGRLEPNSNRFTNPTAEALCDHLEPNQNGFMNPTAEALRSFQAMDMAPSSSLQMQQPLEPNQNGFINPTAETLRSFQAMDMAPSSSLQMQQPLLVTGARSMGFEAPVPVPAPVAGSFPVDNWGAPGNFYTCDQIIDNYYANQAYGTHIPLLNPSMAQFNDRMMMATLRQHADNVRFPGPEKGLHPNSNPNIAQFDNGPVTTISRKHADNKQYPGYMGDDSVL